MRALLKINTAFVGFSANVRWTRSKDGGFEVCLLDFDITCSKDCHSNTAASGLSLATSIFKLINFLLSGIVARTIHIV